MTNRELLSTPRDRLDGGQQQRQHALRVELMAMPCPACRRPLDALRAAGVDVDAYDFGAEQKSYRCPDCGAELQQVVPVIVLGPQWHWELTRGWLEDRLRKADLYDREHEEGK